MYDLNDFIQRARAEIGDYSRHEQRFNELIRENEVRLADLRGRRDSAWLELGKLALPHPDEPVLGALAGRFNLPQLAQIAQDVDCRRRTIDDRITQIDSSAVYQERESRRVHIGAELDEEGPLFEFARQELQKMMDLPGMQELAEEGWGTERYEHKGWLRFFNPEFLMDWRRADAIVEKLQLESFDEAAKQYAERVEQVKTLKETVQGLHEELVQIDALEQERSALLAERDALPAALQQRVGRALGEMLQTRGRDAVRDFPNPDDALRVFAALEGVEHQTRYLEEMNDRVRGDLSQLMDRAGRLQEEARRYESDPHRYRNKQFSEEQFGKRFGRTGRYDKVYDRYDRMSQTVYIFNDYDRGAMLQDFLWWDLMTRGRYDGGFLPEVSNWREQHPSYTYSESMFEPAYSAPEPSGPEPEAWVQQDQS